MLSGKGKDDVSTPQTIRPIWRRTKENEQTLEPIEKGSGGVSVVPVPFGPDMINTLTGSPSYELPLLSRPHFFLSDDESVFDSRVSWWSLVRQMEAGV
eukprot:5825108-Pleurochrysis_carterae.AAC.1